MIISIIAIIIGIGGIILTIRYLFSYLRKRKINSLKRAALTFFVSCVLFCGLIIIVENQYPYAIPKKEVVLSAAREASLGGILLRLYADSTFEMGNFREITNKGVYKIIADTLIISATNNSNGFRGESTISFLINEKFLIEVKNTGINVLEIHENKLK